MPTRVADRTPRGIDRPGLRRSPDNPTPAVIPVNAGKQIAKTKMNGAASPMCAFSGICVTNSPDVPFPRKNMVSDTPRITQTT